MHAQTGKGGVVVDESVTSSGIVCVCCSYTHMRAIECAWSLVDGPVRSQLVIRCQQSAYAASIAFHAQHQPTRTGSAGPPDPP
eukprot:6493671-Prymnesium_polylepis.1